jgi:hypothetical protein
MECDIRGQHGKLPGECNFGISARKPLFYMEFSEKLILFSNGKHYTQNYWGFGLFPLSGILRNRKHDVSETGSVSVFR